MWESGYDRLPCNLLRENTHHQLRMAGFGLRGRRTPIRISPGGEGSQVLKYTRSCREKSQGGGGQVTGVMGRKVCSDCLTSETPLWRSGPAGPKSLCNACGIKYRKMVKRRGLGGDHSRKIRGSSGWKSDGNLSSSMRAEAEAATERLKQRQRKKQERMWLLLEQSRKFVFSCGKEEAEAAVLLMAMSSGLFVHY